MMRWLPDPFWGNPGMSLMILWWKFLLTLCNATFSLDKYPILSALISKYCVILQEGQTLLLDLWCSVDYEAWGWDQHAYWGDGPCGLLHLSSVHVPCNIYDLSIQLSIHLCLEFSCIALKACINMLLNSYDDLDKWVDKWVE